MAGAIEPPVADGADLSTARIPDQARMPKFALTMAWWSLCSAMVYLIIGASLALFYGTANAVIGMVLSVLVYSVVNFVLTRYAIKTGLSVSLFSRVLFGSAGAALATLILAATVIYYAVFESSVIAVAMNALFPSISYPVAALIVVVYSVPLVFGSVQNWLDKLNGILLPFYIIGLIAAVAMTVHTYGGSSAWLHFGPPKAPSTGWWDCFVYYMGVWVFMMAAFDFARFGKKADTRYHGTFNFGAPFWTMAFVINGLIGIFLVSTIPGSGAPSEVSVVLALLKLMGLWGFGFLLVTQTRINTANYYLATINTHAFFQRTLGLNFPKFVWTILVGVIVYGLMLSGIFAKLFEALAYQGVFVVAWVAVALAHILSDNSGQLTEETADFTLSNVPTFNVGGLVAWFAGVAVGIGMMDASASLRSFSAPSTFVVSVAAYLVISAYAKRTPEVSKV
jgi:purine-cytosine permease-like protein